MAQRIATQLLAAIQNHLDANTAPAVEELTQWKKWAKALDARMRLDGSKKSKQHKKPKSAKKVSRKAK